MAGIRLRSGSIITLVADDGSTVVAKVDVTKNQGERQIVYAQVTGSDEVLRLLRRKGEAECEADGGLRYTLAKQAKVGPSGARAGRGPGAAAVEVPIAQAEAFSAAALALAEVLPEGGRHAIKFNANGKSMTAVVRGYSGRKGKDQD